MKRSALTLCLVAAAVMAVSTTAAAGARTAPNCDTKRYVTTITFRNGHRVKHYKRFQTAAASSKVRVYSTVGDDFMSVYYTCWYATGRLHRLAVNTSGADVFDAYVENIQIRGRYVAYTYSASGDAPNNYDRFVVVDAAKGRVVRSLTVQQPELVDRLPPAIALTGPDAIAYWSQGGVAHAALLK